MSGKISTFSPKQKKKNKLNQKVNYPKTAVLLYRLCGSVGCYDKDNIIQEKEENIDEYHHDDYLNSTNILK